MLPFVQAPAPVTTRRVGNDLGILVLRCWDIRNQYVYYSDQYTRQSVFSYWPFIDAQGDEKVYLGLSTEHSFSYTVTPYRHELFFSQCYLVSPNSVKPITMPEALESVMETWNPFPTYEEQSFDLNNNETDPPDLFYGVEGGSICTGDDDSHGNGYVGTTTSVSKSYTARVYDNPDVINLFTARLRINYGFSVLSTLYPTSQPINTSFSSPVLYSFISDPSAMTVDSDPLNTDYAHIKSVYPEVSTLRKFISPQVVETDSAFRLEIHQAISSPESANTPVPTTPVSRGSWFNIPQKPEDYNSSWRHYMTWDWEKPGYCRSKALDLGFSSEDLKP